MPPVLPVSLGGTRRGQALLGLQQPAHQLVQGVAGDPPVRMVGGLSEQRVGLGLLLKTHPVRVHPRPSSSRPVCPPSSRGIRLSDSRRASQWCQGLCLRRFVRVCTLPSWQAPRRAGNGCLEHRLRVALGPLHTPRPRAFHPGPCGAASLGGLSPTSPSSPAPPTALGAGPWLVPWTWSGQTPRRTGT